MSPILGIFASRQSAPASSYESIATVSSSGSSGTLSFTSIPGSYSALQIRGLYSGDGGFLFTLNGNTSAVYTGHNLRADGTTLYAAGNATANGYANFTTTPTGSSLNLHACIIDIVDYASTSKNKTVRMFDGYEDNSSGVVALFSAGFLSASAITSITLDANGTWRNKTTFSLYGIKGA